MRCILKELRTTIEANFLVFADSNQSLLIAIQYIDYVDAVLQSMSDWVVILKLCLELTLVDNFLILSLVLHKGDFVFGDI